jgi:hypothetical protein
VIGEPLADELDEPPDELLDEDAEAPEEDEDDDEEDEPHAASANASAAATSIPASLPLRDPGRRRSSNGNVPLIRSPLCEPTIARTASASASCSPKLRSRRHLIRRRPAATKRRVKSLEI